MLVDYLLQFQIIAQVGKVYCDLVFIVIENIDKANKFIP